MVRIKVQLASWLSSTEYFVDIEGYPNPSIITGDEQRPDFAIVKDDNLLLLELTAGFETNINKNFDRKVKRYQHLLAC